MPDTLNVGIIGLGHIGQFHVAALHATRGLQVRAVCDRDTSLAGLVSDDIAFYVDPRSLLANDEIDVVIVATPNETHAPLALEALRAGRDVILEKPSGVSAEEFAEIARVAEQPSSPHLYHALHAAHGAEVHWWTQPENAHMRDGLGPVTAFACEFFDPYIKNGKRIPAADGLGDSWIDSGVNALSVLHQVVGLEGMVPVGLWLSRMSQVGIADATMHCRFPVAWHDPLPMTGQGGLGSIHTNWTLGLNHKQTRLAFGKTCSEVLLDHSNERIAYRDSAGQESLIFVQPPGRPRLLTHYLNLFSDYLALRQGNKSNHRHAALIARMLFSEMYA